MSPPEGTAGHGEAAVTQHRGMGTQGKGQGRCPRLYLDLLLEEVDFVLLLDELLLLLGDLGRGQGVGDIEDTTGMASSLAGPTQQHKKGAAELWVGMSCPRAASRDTRDGTDLSPHPGV